MFAKPYKLKSSNALKNSEKKHLVQRIQDEFSCASEEKVKELVPIKGSCLCMKLVLHSGDFVNVYASDGVPMLIETPEGLIPTVCALWKVPDLVPVLTIHSPVLAKVQNGAPLYLPGVSLPAQGAGFPLFRAGAVLGARTEDNAAACLVGRAAISSADMLLRASGVCLDTLHVYGDTLCKDQKFSKIARPKLASTQPASIPDNLTGNFQQITLQAAKEEWPSLGPRPAAPSPAPPPAAPAPAPHQPQIIPDSETEPSEDQDEDNTMLTESSLVEDDIPEDMDGLLRWCLLSFLKIQLKDVTLPLMTNLLYKNHLQALCPPGRTLDVKKSSYKKLSKFLEAMQEEGLVEVREVQRGAWALAGAARAHPALRRHRGPARPQVAKPVEEKEYTPPQVREVFCVTAAVQDLFPDLRKGTAVSASEVRAALVELVRARDLRTPRGLRLDPSLAKLLARPDQQEVGWEEVVAGALARMTAATEMRFADGSLVLSKTRLEPVRMRVALRSGNKKVTLVSNLESFGFKLAALAGACQRGVAAAARVTREPGARADQLMLQGDQTHFVAKLLIEKYELPKKFVEGADKALNKKK